MEDVVQVLIPFVVDYSWLRGGHEWGNIDVALHIRGDVNRLELRVDAMCDGIGVGIGSGPAVVLNGIVKRLGTVPDVMSQPADIDVGRGDPYEYIDLSVGARLTQVVLAGHSRQKSIPESHRETR